MRLTIISNICKLNLYLDNTTVGKDSVQLLVEMAPQLDDVFDYCNYLGQKIDCGKLFQETLTGDGLCFSFNTLDSGKIFNEKLYEQVIKFM